MRRERQPRTENAPENSPSPTPHRTCRVEEGEPTGTEQVAGVRRQRATPESLVHEGTEETEASSRAPNARPEAPPPLPLDQSRAGGEKKPREATQGHPETPQPHPALLKEGREKKGRPGVHDFRRRHSCRQDIGAVEELPEGRKWCFASAKTHFS